MTNKFLYTHQDNLSPEGIKFIYQDFLSCLKINKSDIYLKINFSNYIYNNYIN